jgi:hypothetical protein
MTIRYRIRGGKQWSGRYRLGNGATVNGDTTFSLNSNYIVEKLTDVQRRPKGHVRAHLTPKQRKRFEATQLRIYGTRDTGGPFSVQRRTTSVWPAYVSNASTNKSHVGLWWDYTGYVWPVGTPNGLPLMSSAPSLISTSLMTGEGIKGWNKFKPTHTQVNIGQTLGELRAIGGLPISPKMIHEMMELGRVLRHPIRTLRHAIRTGVPGHDALRYAGSGYLGYQFGIKPYVDDIMDLTKSLLEFDKRIAQLVRDNGRPVRREGSVSFTEAVTETHTTAAIGGSYFLPTVATQLHVGPFTKDVTVRNTIKFWFSGRFRYHLDPTRHGVGPIPAREKYQLQRILYGLDPTDVSLIWELMPWSWLIDWIVPIGPMIDNLVNDKVDRLVADYAYIMGNSVTSTYTDVKGQLAGAPPFQTQLLVYDETKQRAKATPYGFGQTFAGFSLRQLSILAALGVSR